MREEAWYWVWPSSSGLRLSRPFVRVEKRSWEQLSHTDWCTTSGYRPDRLTDDSEFQRTNQMNSPSRICVRCLFWQIATWAMSLGLQSFLVQCQRNGLPQRLEIEGTLFLAYLCSQNRQLASIIRDQRLLPATPTTTPTSPLIHKQSFNHLNIMEKSTKTTQGKPANESVPIFLRSEFESCMEMVMAKSFESNESKIFLWLCGGACLFAFWQDAEWPMLMTNPVLSSH